MEVQFKKGIIRHDLREQSFVIKGIGEDTEIYHIKIKETSCEYDTKTKDGKYFAELIDCHRHSEAVNIIVQTEIHPIHKETLKGLNLIPIKNHKGSTLKKILSFFNMRHEYLLDPFWEISGKTNDHPDKKDGRYEKFLELLNKTTK